MPSELTQCATCGRILAPETVTIAAAQLASLLDKSSRYDALSLATARPHQRSPIDGNAELAAFLVMAAPTMTLAQLATASAARFGEPIAPSKSAIQRFLKRASRRGGLNLFPDPPR